MGLINLWFHQSEKCHEPKSGMDYAKNAMYLKTENAINKGRWLHRRLQANLIFQGQNYAFHMDSAKEMMGFLWRMDSANVPGN